MEARVKPLAGVGDELSLDAMGTEVLGALFSGLRTLQVHDISNAAVAGASERLAQLFSQLVHGTGMARLTFLEEDVYLNGHRVRVARAELPRYIALVRELKAAGVMRIEATTAVTDSDVRLALKVINTRVPDAAVENVGGLTVEFARGRASKLPDYLIDRRQYALRVYAKAVLFLQEFAESLQDKRVPPIRKAYRLVQDLVDIAQADVLPLLGLATIRDHSDVFFHHSVNVSILSIAVGQRLKMPKQALAELGMAGLLHDLGKLSVPLRILRKTTPLSPDERKVVDRIPLETVRVLARHESISRGHPEQLVLAYEHHLTRSVKDYERQYGRQAVYYQSQILSVANYYDALTTARAHRGAVLPDQVLRLILEQAGTRFDSVVVRVFVNLLGRYPLGTLAVLDDGSMGVVVHTVPDEPRRPLVKVVLDAAGARIDGPYLDLAGEARGREIVASANPYEYKINVLKYLMG